jgi:hypothetical protein
MMPTGSEFSDVRMGSGDQSYKQTDREMSGGVDGQTTGPAGPNVAGNYPNVYDRQMGSEPTTPSNYTERAFSGVSATGPKQDYTTSERQSVSGEYGFTDQPNLNGVFVSDNMVPQPVASKQFSSKMSGDPKELLANAQIGVKAHGDLVSSYGYNMPTATLGSHPWLRDSLANTTENEPGQAEPLAGEKMPGRDT